MKSYLLVIPAVLLSCSLLAQSNLCPTTLNGKTVTATYTSGNPKGTVLKVHYNKPHFTTTILKQPASRSTADGGIQSKLTGTYSYQLKPNSSNQAVMTLTPATSQSSFNGSTQTLLFTCSKNGAAKFSDKGRDKPASGTIEFQ